MHYIGSWEKKSLDPAFEPHLILPLIQQIREPIHIVRADARGPLGVALGGSTSSNGATPPRSYQWLGTLPALYPEWLGDRDFLETHGVRFPYIVGEMATGIATSSLVIESSRAGMLGFFGSAGVPLDRTEKAIDEIESSLGPTASWGMNLIHSPNEPAMEAATVDLFLRRKVRRVSASAFMGLTPSVVRYALSGVRRDPATGGVVRENHVFAKISRPEVARHFMTPVPQAMLHSLAEQGYLTREEAKLGLEVPVAEDVTVEADSGGHTDNRPLTALLPTILALRNEVCAQQGYRFPIRVGAAGGLGVPSAISSAFSLGASFVMTGSVNQASVEAGTSSDVKRLLAQAGIADVVMAPAADMFELGVKVQVLKRSTLFGVRAQFLYDLYLNHDSLDSIPAELRARLEGEFFREPLAQTWTRTREYWNSRDPEEVSRAERDPKHRMALCFRAYLGEASRWARSGASERRLDYQIWCGPAMGAFNAWVKGSFLEAPENRTVAQISRNLLEGAAVIARAQQLRTYGIAIPREAFDFRPRPLE